MELRTLRYFVTVAEQGTVTAAAETLHVTQPGVSRQVRSLETDLGVDLFAREKGRLDLTAAGRAILPLAREILRQSDGLRVAAQHHAHGVLERLSIAAPATTLTDVVAPFVATLRREDPLPAVLESDGWTTAECFRQGADLVLTLAGSHDDRHTSVQLPALPVFACIPRNHPLAGRAVLRLDELAGSDLIGLPPHASARKVLDEAVTAWGLPPLALTEASNGTIAQALAAAGRGIALVTDEARYGLIALPIADPQGRPLTFRLACVWEKHHPAADALAELVQRLATWTATQFA